MAFAWIGNSDDQTVDGNNRRKCILNVNLLTVCDAAHCYSAATNTEPANSGSSFCFCCCCCGQKNVNTSCWPWNCCECGEWWCCCCGGSCRCPINWLGRGQREDSTERRPTLFIKSTYLTESLNQLIKLMFTKKNRNNKTKYLKVNGNKRINVGKWGLGNPIGKRRNPFRGQTN